MAIILFLSTIRALGNCPVVMPIFKCLPFRDGPTKTTGLIEGTTSALGDIAKLVMGLHLFRRWPCAGVPAEVPGNLPYGGMFSLCVTEAAFGNGNSSRREREREGEVSYWCSSGGGKSIMEIPRIDREGERNYFFEERFSFLLGGRCGNGALHSSSSSRELLIVEIAVLICSRTEMINSGWPHKLFRISMSNVLGCLCGEFEKSTQKARGRE